MKTNTFLLDNYPKEQLATLIGQAAFNIFDNPGASLQSACLEAENARFLELFLNDLAYKSFII